jgi:hypothetical protein
MAKVYHLKHADFIRDMMCFDIETAKSIIDDASRKADEKIDPNKVISAIMNCSCTKSNEGFEACLNVRREEFLPSRQLMSDPRFEKLLEELDKAFDAIKGDWAEHHVL